MFKKIIYNLYFSTFCVGFLIFILSINSFSATYYDSLIRKLHFCTWEDSVSIYLELSKKHLTQDPIKSIDYGLRASGIANRNHDKKLKADAHISIGDAYESSGQPDIAMKYYKDALSLFIISDEPNSIANTYNNIGILFYQKKVYDSALVYYKKALFERKKIGNREDIAKTLNNIGGVYIVLGKYDEAVKYVSEMLEINKILSNKKDIADNYGYMGYINLKLEKLDAALFDYLRELKLREELDDKEEIDKFLTNIGKIYFKLGKHQKAEEYYLKALKINENNRNQIEIAKSLSNLGNVFYEVKDYRKALDYYHKSLSITDKTGNEKNLSESGKKSYLMGKAVLLNNIGLVYKNLADYKKALDYCKRSISIKDELGDMNNLYYPLTSIAEIYLKLGNYDESLNNLAKALNIAKEKNNPSLMQEVHYLMSEVYNHAGNYKSALENHKIYTSIKDSLLMQYNNKMLSEMQTKYESVKKEQENHILKEANIIQRNYFIVIFALILIVLVVTFGRYRNKQKANLLLNEKNQQIKQQHSELEYMFSQLQAKEENLLIANSTKDKFFSIIAHDLKNPLQAITMSSELLLTKHDVINREQLIALIRNINTAGNHLSSLLDNLLQWSRTQSGNISFQPETLDLANTVYENIELLESVAEKKNITLSSNIPQNSLVFADSNMLSSIIRNLLSNAIKFTGDFGKCTVDINDEDELFYEIAVIDTGIGISEEDIKKLFRIDVHHTTIGTSKENGTGLGLILCKEFVDINGGKIRVESMPGEGSRFIFSLQKASQNINVETKNKVNVLSLN